MPYYKIEITTDIKELADMVDLISEHHKKMPYTKGVLMITKNEEEFKQ